jgi:Zn finger protein HypA/HybF involved in hydrogenase expression
MEEVINDNYAVIKCERCSADGAMLAFDWALLCSQCKSLDYREWEYGQLG